MSFDPAFADETYPDRDLRFAAFASDPTLSLQAALRWLEQLDPESIHYPQHRMITRMLRRHGEALGDGPKITRLTGIRRQLWTRAKVNLTLLTPALAALANEANFLRLISGGLDFARGVTLADDGLDVIDLIARRNRKQAIADALVGAGWQMSPWLVRNFEHAAVMYFSAGQTGRLRVLMPRAFKGTEPSDLLGEGIASDQWGTLQGIRFAGFSPAQTFIAAIASAELGHVLAAHWLFDLANLRTSWGFDLNTLPEALAEQGKATLIWVQQEAGLT